jgi:hypothetical protein
MSHATRIKNLRCDICKRPEATEATHLEDDSRAILVPAGWRLIWKGPAITFRCPACWKEMPTGQYPLEPTKLSDKPGESSGEIVVSPT